MRLSKSSPYDNFSYDGSKLIREIRDDAVVLGRYRQAEGRTDAMGAIAEIFTNDMETGDGKAIPTFDERGSVVQIGAAEPLAYYTYDRFGVMTQTGSGARQRARFVSPAFVNLDRFSQVMYLTDRACFLPRIGVTTIVWPRLLPAWPGSGAKFTPPLWRNLISSMGSFWPDLVFWMAPPPGQPCLADTPIIWIVPKHVVADLDKRTDPPGGFTQCRDKWAGSDKYPQTGPRLTLANPPARRTWEAKYLFFIEYPISDPDKNCRHTVLELARKEDVARRGVRELYANINEIPPGGHDEFGDPTGPSGPRITIPGEGEITVKEQQVRPTSIRTKRAANVLRAPFDQVIIDCDLPGWPSFAVADFRSRSMTIDQRGEILDASEDLALRARTSIRGLGLDIRTVWTMGRVGVPVFRATGPESTEALGNL